VRPTTPADAEFPDQRQCWLRHISDQTPVQPRFGLDLDLRIS